MELTMSETINGSPTFSNSHTVPTAGQLVTAAAHKGYAQSLANNDKWIYDKLIAGVDRVRSVANLAALQALTGMVDGDVVNCVSLGFFRFHATDATSANNVTIVAPGVGSGRWRHVAVDLRGVANGLAPLDGSQLVPVANLPTNVANGVAGLDGSAKIPSAILPLRPVNQWIITTAKVVINAASGWTLLGDIIPTDVVSGDILIVKATLPILADYDLGWDPGVSVSARISGSTFATSSLGTVSDLHTDSHKTRSLPGWAVVTVTGQPDHVRFEVSVGTSTTGVGIYPAMATVEQWRP
jgi:hypothetical protein